VAWDGAVDRPQIARARALRGLGIDVRLGGDGVELLAGIGTLVKSPGVRLDAPLVVAARARGIPMVDELDIGWRLVPVPTYAVTGTKGKSTVATVCAAMLAAHGIEPALAGNTEFGPAVSELSLGEPPAAVVAEVSSYQAESSPALTADAAIFTGLSLDHVDRYDSLESYGDAKRRLFAWGERVVPLAILNVDDDFGRRLAAELDQRDCSVVRYGQAADADYRIESCRWGSCEAEATIATPTDTTLLHTRLPGVHNAGNAVALLALSDSLGLPREPTLTGLAAAAPVPGRFEMVAADLPFEVMVDLAFTEDSVTKTLETARALVEPRGGRLLTVAGLVGRSGPDTGKEVGAAARRLSDHLVLSGVSYRGEPRLVTLTTLAAGARAAKGGTLEIVIDRRAAIARALELARPGDFVALLGRGPIAHEATDWRGGFVPLDDREVVLELARRCGS